jgi:uncharacterized caspase-like protein
VRRDSDTTAIRTPRSRGGRDVIAVIGIDRYRRWPRLSNAVNDARGALETFSRLGFESVTAPLFDEAATADAIRSLVTDDLAGLNKNDRLVVFFAGHGHTTLRTFQEGDSVKTGYIIPVDGDAPGGATARWLRLDSWLSDVARLEVKHILVFLDACHSGIALGSLIKWRGSNPRSEAFERLGQRRSRRVITSALDDQRAMDGGPIPGHSLFTGCLIDGLNGDIAPHGELVTGSQIGLYLQDRVTSYPHSEQTPDFGALEQDKRGELLLRIVTEPTTTVRSIAPEDPDTLEGSAGPEAAGAAEAPELAPIEAPAEHTTSRYVQPLRDEATTQASIMVNPAPADRVMRAASLQPWLWIALTAAAIASSVIGIATYGVRSVHSARVTTEPPIDARDEPGNLVIDAGAGIATVELINLETGTHVTRPLVMKVTSQPPGAEIWIDGRPGGVTPTSIKLTAAQATRGTLHFEMHKAGYRTLDRAVQLSGYVDDGTAAVITLHEDLERQDISEILDTIIDSHPGGAKVEIVGTDQSGPAPFTAKLESGKSYKARVTARGFATFELDVKGAEKQVVNLVAKPRVIAIDSDPPGALIWVDYAATGHSTPFDIELTAAQAAKKTVSVQLRKAGFRGLDRVVDLAKLSEDDTRMTTKIDEKLVGESIASTAPDGSPATSTPEGATPNAPPRVAQVGARRMVPWSSVTKISGSNPSITTLGAADLPPSIMATLCIDETGHVTSSKLVSQLPAEASAEINKVLRIWQYEPYRVDGIAQAVCFPVTFRAK